jgi:hypothetical protein
VRSSATLKPEVREGSRADIRIWVVNDSSRRRRGYLPLDVLADTKNGRTYNTSKRVTVFKLQVLYIPSERHR